MTFQPSDISLLVAPTPNPSRMREGRILNKTPSRMRAVSDSPHAGGVGGGEERASIFSPRSQGAFLENLSLNGNVRLACRAARVSPQTAYRARRASPAFAALWDAALLSARDNAEQVLADRALNGWEEAVFYHGEEVATRRRYSDRLLLAHLARLDRLAERAEVSAALADLDDAVEALGRGEELVGPPCEQPGAPACAGAHDRAENFHQDRVPCVPSRRIPPSSSNAVGRQKTPSISAAGDPGSDQLPDLERRLRAMEAARPMDAPPIGDWSDPGLAEAMQLAAFEAGMANWWLAGPVERE